MAGHYNGDIAEKFRSVVAEWCVNRDLRRLRAQNRYQGYTPNCRRAKRVSFLQVEDHGDTADAYRLEIDQDVVSVLLSLRCYR